MAEADGPWRLPTPEGFRLAPTVLSHGVFPAPPFHWDRERETLTRVLRVPGHGPRALEIREESEERVEVVPDEAGGVRPETVRRRELVLDPGPWTPGEDGRAAVEEAVVFMLGLDRDVRPFHRLCRDDPALARVPRIGAGRLLRCPTLWEELARAICGAGAPWGRAVESIAALTDLGEPAGDLRAWARPDRVLEAGASRLARDAGLGDRAAHLVALARRIDEGELDPAPAEAGALDRDELLGLFLSVDGIDAATAHRLLVPYGHTGRLRVDRHVVADLRDRRFGGRAPSEEEVRALYERYGEWSALAYWLDVVVNVWWPRLGVSL